MKKPVYKIISVAFLYALLAPFCFAATPGASQEAVRWLYKAINAYERGEYTGAKMQLRVALELEPNFSEAYALKGLLEYIDGDFDKSEASYKRAQELNPRMPREIRKKLEKKARGIESTLTKQDFGRFQLQFNGGEKREQAWQVVKYLDEAYNEMVSRFEVPTDNPFTVIVFTTQEFWDAWMAPVWLGGFFDSRDGRIRVSLDVPPGGEDELRRRLRHEFTHAYMHRIYKGALPVWFKEGSAQFYAYASSSGLWKENRLAELQRMLKGAPWMDLASVEKTIQKKDAKPAAIYLAYLESEGLILHIARERGETWMPSLMQKVRQGATFEAAFNEIVGVSAAEMLERLRKSIS